jgi:predicted nucleic acid-binding protein
MTEFERALKHKLKLPRGQVTSAKTEFGAVKIVAKPGKPSKVPVLDPTDRWVLAAVIVGRTEVLVTAYDDLLSVASQTPLLILCPRHFWEMLRSGHA